MLTLVLGACGAVGDIDIGIGGGGDPTTTFPRPTTSTTDPGPDEPEPGEPDGPETCDEPPVWALTVVTAQDPDGAPPERPDEPGDLEPGDEPDDPCEPTPDPGPTPEPELGTGDVQITLRWSSSADIDLHVFEPDGTEIWYSDPGPTATGGRLDVDSNVGCEQEASVENVFWPEGDMPVGGYRVVVTGFEVDGCGSGDYEVTASVQGQPVLDQTGTVATDEQDEFTFQAG
jgi:hypothetical protein